MINSKITISMNLNLKDTTGIEKGILSIGYYNRADNSESQRIFRIETIKTVNIAADKLAVAAPK